MIDLISRGRISAETIVRGPSTRQLWTFAGRTPGLSHRVGWCYACRAKAAMEQSHCGHCGASFEIEDDRQQLGLAPAQLLPSQTSPEAIAESLMAGVSADSERRVATSTSLPTIAPPRAMPKQVAESEPAREAARVPTPVVAGHGRALALIALIAAGALGFGLWSLTRSRPAPLAPTRVAEAKQPVQPRPMPVVVKEPPAATPDPRLAAPVLPTEPATPPARSEPEPTPPVAEPAKVDQPEWVSAAVAALAAVPIDQGAFDAAVGRAGAGDAALVAELKAQLTERRAALARRAIP